MTDEEKQKHERTKKIFKYVGVGLAVAGIVLFIVFIVDFVSSMNAGNMPGLFFIGVFSLPLIAIGISLIMFGSRREIARFMKNESVPVINEASEELKPAIKAVVGAVSEARNDNVSTVKCSGCGAENSLKNKFCDRCGAQLFKICPACGAKQEADDKFCGECGAKLD